MCRGLSVISPNVLTQRLNELEAALVVQRLKLPPPASVWAYRLTPWGQQLEPIILQLAQWGEPVRGMPDRPDARIQAGTDALLKLAYGKADLDQAVKAGTVAFTGDKGVVQSFLDLFSLPEGAFGNTNAATIEQSR